MLEDPNVIYGGDLGDFGKLTEGCVSLGQYILRNLEKGGNQRSLINANSDEIWTFSDVLRETKVVAKTLFGLGVRKNDVISILAENRHEFTAISFGAICLNAIVAPINITYTERELVHALNLSKPKFVFVSKSLALKTAAICKKIEFVQNVVAIDGTQGDNFTLLLQDLIKKYENTEFELGDHVTSEIDMKTQTCLIFCSSGTTGMPKGVEITHQNVIYSLLNYRDRIDYFEELHKVSIIASIIGPWFHVLGFISMMMYGCRSGAVFVFLPKFEEKLFYHSIQKYKINFVDLVPPIMVLLAKSSLVDDYDLSSLKDLASGAAALSKELEDKVRERFNVSLTIRQSYGMTETALGVIAAIKVVKPGSVGQVFKGMYAKVVDTHGKSLGPHQSGELWFKGNRVMKGYINNPEATREAIDQDGWLHTGDIAYYDNDKNFFIVDRLKELIKYKGFQVPPAEIEGLLLSHSKIADCCVIGIPDEETGELPLAFVVKQPSVELTEKEVQEFVAANTSKPKWLRGGVKFIEGIPKSPSGKILRRMLRELNVSLKSRL